MRRQIGALPLLSFFSLIGLLSIAVAAALLALLYRQITISNAVEVAQSHHVALAQATLAGVRPELDEFLAIAARAGPQEAIGRRLSVRVSEVLAGPAQEGLATKVRLYNRRGIVVFSTEREELGRNESANEGFLSALNGEIQTRFTYRDRLSALVSAPSDANLMRTDIPLGSPPVQAVFEMQSDMSPLVAANERALLIIVTRVGLVLLVLYAVLILVVRQARNLFESQRQIIEERTAALEKLSAQMLSSDELEKKKLAFDLHEGVAQTLSAVKVRLEELRGLVAGRMTDGEPLASVIPVLQKAIEEVQSMATGLRPSSLDQLGLLPTLEWFCREFVRRHPHIRVEQDLVLQEGDTPGPLKVVLYRVIESAFRDIARHEDSERIVLSLKAAEGAVLLLIDDTPSDSRYASTASRSTDADLQQRFAEAQERTILSGGTFSAARNKAGGVTLQASWKM